MIASTASPAADFLAVKDVLLCPDPQQKIAGLRELLARWPTAGVPGGEDAVQPIAVPGRPERPLLVAPRALESRGLGTPVGRAVLVHAIAHIEFNAINLALDAVYRFRGMPEAYYRDWLGVAADEARHFELLAARLGELGFEYGEYPAHNGLWEAACRTDHSCLQRMALVPRVLEARGLDVTPAMIARLRHAGDAQTALILELILREEVAHVECGTRWFQYCCALDGVDAEATFLDLVRTHASASIRLPFNADARLRAGFTTGEQAGLERIAELHQGH